MRRKRESAGFTLIELLLVVAIIGIIAAIAVPNLLNALDRGKQKRTMADLRSLGSAVEQYAVDNTIYPTASSVAALETILEPFYMNEIPSEDGWGRTFGVTSIAIEYTIGSGGKDGGGLSGSGGPTTNLNDAIIYANGQFWQWPEGTQQ